MCNHSTLIVRLLTMFLTPFCIVTNYSQKIGWEFRSASMKSSLTTAKVKREMYVHSNITPCYKTKINQTAKFNDHWYFLLWYKGRQRGTEHLPSGKQLLTCVGWGWQWFGCHLIWLLDIHSFSKLSFLSLNVCRTRLHASSDNYVVHYHCLASSQN